MWRLQQSPFNPNEYNLYRDDPDMDQYVYAFIAPCVALIAFVLYTATEEPSGWVPVWAILAGLGGMLACRLTPDDYRGIYAGLFLLTFFTVAFLWFGGYGWLYTWWHSDELPIHLKAANQMQIVLPADVRGKLPPLFYVGKDEMARDDLATLLVLDADGQLIVRDGGCPPHLARTYGRSPFQVVNLLPGLKEQGPVGEYKVFREDLEADWKKRVPLYDVRTEQPIKPPLFVSAEVLHISGHLRDP